LGNRPDRQGYQSQLVVVTGNPVCFQFAAYRAPVNKYPFTAAFNRDSNRLHNAAARRCPVARPVIHVHTPQAARAVIAMACAVSFLFDYIPAVPADKFITGISPTFSRGLFSFNIVIFHIKSSGILFLLFIATYMPYRFIRGIHETEKPRMRCTRGLYS
jgi:hypothetical protein